MERRIVDLEARLAASETNLRKAEERSASAEARVDDACVLWCGSSRRGHG